MRLSIPIVAQHQWEDAMLETVNDDARVQSFLWISLLRASDGTVVLFAQLDGHMRWEPGRTVH